MTRQRRRATEVLDREYEGTTNSLREARAEAVGWLNERRIDQDVQDRAAMVLSELASNAVQASPGATYGVRVSLADEGSVIIVVTSRTVHDRPPPRESWGPSALLATSGRGLLIVDKLSDLVDVGKRAGTVVVTATLRPAVQH